MGNPPNPTNPLNYHASRWAIQAIPLLNTAWKWLLMVSINAMNMEKIKENYCRKEELHENMRNWKDPRTTKLDFFFFFLWFLRILWQMKKRKTKKQMQKMRVTWKHDTLEQPQNKTSVLISCDEQRRENLKENRVLEGFLFLPFWRKECSFSPLVWGWNGMFVLFPSAPWDERHIHSN